MAAITVSKNQDKNLYGRQLYELHKELHRCAHCGKQDAYTLGGRSMCFECCEYDRTRGKKYHQANLDKDHQRTKNLREKYLSEHRCTKCGKSIPPYDKRKMCSWCLAKARERQAKKRSQTIIPVEIRESQGLCVKCGKNEAYQEFKLCKSCYDVVCSRLSKARASVNKEAHYWRKDSNNVFKSNKVQRACP